MLFSKSRPTVAKVTAMIKGTAATRPVPPQPARRLNLLQTQEGGVTAAPSLADIKEVPDGRYFPFASVDIPEAFMTSFAFLTTSEQSGTLLVADDAAATHPQFELQRRLSEHGFKKIVVRKATREIVKAVHDENKSEKNVVATPTEKIANQIVDQAELMKTSDIHIETMDGHARIFYRIFGERIEQPSIAKSTATDVCNVLYNAHGDADSKDVDWDMKTVKDTVIEHTTSDGKQLQLRFSSSPRTPSGNFAAVMRVIHMGEAAFRPIEEIGYTTAMENAIEEMLIGGNGIVILVGPTNSGKSSSMQAMIERLYEIRGRSIKVQTAEDPVEYRIPDAIQSSANNAKMGADFESLIKGMLRQDPDVCMIGEIRDGESSEGVKNLVLTGRKVLSTLHVGEVMAVFPRLREMGIPDSVLFMDKFISGIICQRLLPVLCSECATPVQQAYEEGRVREATYSRVSRVADLYTDNVRVRSLGGCSHCNYTGIVGRTPCAELLVPDTKFLALMAAGEAMAARQYWANKATELNVDGLGVNMMAHAIHKMRQGLVSPADVEAQIGPIVVDVAVAASGRGLPIRATDFPPSLVKTTE